MKYERWLQLGALILPAMIAVSTGCDSRPAVESSTAEASVTGKVVIKGKPATKGTVVFDPANYMRKDVSARSATIEPDGTYRVTTLVGLNSVRVAGPEAEAAGAAYSSLDFEVKSGSNSFDISIPTGQ
ncbi:MAG: hypothetical protein SFX72_09605 [Isosphaeraceae bacterium]|nr:hypothetical protein [Isosphaeraceae bacterium]